jgi:hypothetical protein
MLTLIIALLTSLHLPSTVYARDPGIWVPETAGHYSTLCTYDGNDIRDTEFANYVNDYVNSTGFNSMIFVFEQCFGGGFIDDVVKFGLNHAVPVVAMSASMFNETSWGSGASDGEDYFVQAFAKAINVSTPPDMWNAYSTAKTNDICGPSGADYNATPEDPMFQSRGQLPFFPTLVNESGAVKGKAILWVGEASCDRYWNDINRIHRVLTTRYGFDDVRDIYVLFGDGTSQPWIPGNTLSDGGKIDASATKANLENAFKNWLAPQMNSSVQFFFWSSDHGGEGQDLPDILGPGTYHFQLASSFVNYMMISTENIPSIFVKTHNVLSPDNTVYLNGYLLGTLKTTGPSGIGNDTFHFNDSVVPLYSQTNNTITFESTQSPPYDLANVSISTGGIATMTTPGSVGGISVSVDKLALLAPYIALASTIIVATAATAIYVKHRKKKQ